MFETLGLLPYSLETPHSDWVPMISHTVDSEQKILKKFKCPNTSGKYGNADVIEEKIVHFYFC